MGHACPWWFAYTFDNPLRPLFHNPETIFAPYVREGMHVADIGCGLGYFSLGLAHMVKERGKVLAVDIQPQMLTRLRRRADRAELAAIIHPHLCRDNDLALREPLDFALAFWMMHEAPDPATLFRQLSCALKPSGTLLLSEPLFHVSREDFRREISIARNAGFNLRETPQIRWSYAAALTKDSYSVQSGA
jgi:ubiquinone/menaquinone biosynthesis C-methylase UbiE